MGTDEDWEAGEYALREAMESMAYRIWSTKAMAHFTDRSWTSIWRILSGRTWQCGTIQLDFQMPQRFDITYVGSTERSIARS